MIQKKVTEVEIADIQELVTSQISEGKTIEYKRELSLGSDSEKKEFLADVSSFANTGDGDLLFGVEAKDGIPIAINPLHIESIDAETLRLESIVRSGIDPRFAFTLRPISTSTPNEYVLLFRIYESWNKPHRITFGGSGKFFARSSAGKYELDVRELRQIFTLSDGIEKRMQDFRTERLLTIQTGGTMLPLTSESLIVIHLLPLSSFSTKTILSRDILLGLERETDLTRPMHASSWHAPRINLEGMFSFAGKTGESLHSYVQLFRNGAVELLESSILDRGDSTKIHYVLYELEIVEGIKRALAIQQKVEISMPVFLCVSLLNVRGLSMSNSNRDRFEDDEHAIQQKDLILQPVLYEDNGQDVGKTLQPVFDLVWNACGLPKSKNYDEDGNFTVRR